MTGEYQQEINNIVSAVVNVSYSGAQREADWWSLRRRYDPDNREIYTDEYTAYVLYTIPKAELNRQIALALETSVKADSALYDITIALARDILLQGYNEIELVDTAAITRTAAASYNPPGSPTAVALNEIFPIDEYAVGRDVAASILTNYKLWNDSPRLTRYLNLICAALVINSPRPVLFKGYHVAIIDTPEINAFATPGGHILLSRGLISAAPTEDALAAVIAHEIAHIQLRHSLRAIQTNRDAADWIAQFTNSGAATIASAINNGFSQTQEYDADIAALALLTATGYNPQGLIVMLQELQRIQPGIRGGFNSTHPSPTSRLVNAQIAVARYSQPGTERIAARQNRFNTTKGN
jgi:predicted Zn-dependent protease